MDYACYKEYEDGSEYSLLHSVPDPPCSKDASNKAHHSAYERDSHIGLYRHIHYDCPDRWHELDELPCKEVIYAEEDQGADYSA